MKDTDVLTHKDRRLIFVLLGLCIVIMSGLYMYVQALPPVIADCRSDTPVSPGESCLDRATGTLKSDKTWNEELRVRSATDATNDS